MNKRYVTNTFHIVIICMLIGMAFFPAYLWEQPHLAWIWQLITVWFALVCYIPRLHDMGKYWWIILLSLILRWFFIESIGLITWFPYGQFTYGSALWPITFTWVPYMLAMTWPPLVLWVWSLSNKIMDYKNTRCTTIVYNIFMQTLLLLLVDIILDPIAVAMKLWSYTNPWWRGGVPLSNFGGWLLSGSVAMFIVYFFMRKAGQKQYTGLRYAWWLIYTLVFFCAWYVWKIVL